MLSATEVADRAVQALENGARTVMFLGGEPTIHLATVLDIVALLPDSARLIWKTNGRGTSEARAWLKGLMDVWVVDFKFGNSECARRLVGDPGYVATVQENLSWAANNSDLVVRHLIMPGHVACCWQPVAAWLAEHLPGVKTNLRTGFWPARLTRHDADLRRPVRPEEAQEASRIAAQYQLRLIS
jgi:putative pyruvate formate lyase activating enzyme